MNPPLTFESQKPDQKNFFKKIVPVISKIVKVAGKVNNITGKIVTIASLL
jgi:hypothetical protein